MRFKAPAALILGLCSCLAETPQGEAPAPVRTTWDSFDRVLHSILNASRDRFRIVEGVRIENRRREFYFEAKTYLPDANYCRILQGPVFCCEWDVKDPAAARSLYARLAARIQEALGAEWTKTLKSVKLRQDTLFHAERQPVVQAILHAAPPKVYVVVLPAGSSPDGFTGIIPSLESFLHP